jgi:protein-S-isoprenylcysteine O-methyltransferase Ste14
LKAGFAMEPLEAVRYYLALFGLVSFVPLLAFWLLIHPFVRTWRRLGPGVSYAAVLIVMVVIGVGLFALRGRLLAVEFGTMPVLWLPAVLANLGAIVLEVRTRRQLSLRTLIGLPELAAGTEPGKLLSEGIYARIRHPRYTAGWLGLLALACFTNYLAIYGLLIAYLPVIYAITVLEERELAERFGAAYQRYRERVPRFVPRLW